MLTNFPPLANGQVDAIIGDAIQYFTWLKENNATCGFEAKDYFGTFTTNNYTLADGNSIFNSNGVWKFLVILLIEKKSLYRDEKVHKLKCSRSKDVIEPMLQASMVCQDVRNCTITCLRKRAENVQDWCIIKYESM